MVDANADLAEKLAAITAKCEADCANVMYVPVPTAMSKKIIASLSPTASQPAPDVVGALFEAVGAIADMVDGATANHPARLVLSRGRAALAALSAPLAQDVAAGEAK